MDMNTPLSTVAIIIQPLCRKNFILCEVSVMGAGSAVVSIVPLMALFSWAMVPLAMGNVLLNNLLAHSRFKVVPAVAALAVGYWIALQYFHDSFKMVLEVLGVFSTLFLVVCAVFTWFPQGRAAEKAGAAPGQA